MSIGKEKCEIFRRIRQSVAEKYGLDYESSECTYEGECSGACPKCDAELEMLQRQLDSRGYIDVDSNGFESFEESFEDLYGNSFTSCEINVHVMPESKQPMLQGVVVPLENDMLQGEVAPSDDVQTVASSPRVNPKRRNEFYTKSVRLPALHSKTSATYGTNYMKEPNSLWCDKRTIVLTRMPWQ